MLLREALSTTEGVVFVGCTSAWIYIDKKDDLIRKLEEKSNRETKRRERYWKKEYAEEPFVPYLDRKVKKTYKVEAIPGAICQ